MKYRSSDIKKVCISACNGELTSLLVYGPNRGMIDDIVSVLAKHLQAQVDSFDIDSRDLEMECNTRSFFVKKKVLAVRVKTTVPNKDKLLKKTLHFPILIADDLPTSNALRKWFEKENGIAIIPCYLDDDATRRDFILYYLKERNVVPDRDALQYLVSSLEADRAIIKAELNKLATYVATSTDAMSSASLQDCMNVVIAQTTPQADLMCAHFMLRDHVKFQTEIENLVAEGINAVWIVRAIGRYCMNLYTVHTSILSGNSLESAMSTLKPPVFFKYVAIFKQCISATNIQNIRAVLRFLWQCEIELKTGYSEEIIIYKLLYTCMRSAH